MQCIEQGLYEMISLESAYDSSSVTSDHKSGWVVQLFNINLTYSDLLVDMTHCNGYSIYQPYQNI